MEEQFRAACASGAIHELEEIKERLQNRNGDAGFESRIRNDGICLCASKNFADCVDVLLDGGTRHEESDPRKLNFAPTVAAFIYAVNGYEESLKRVLDVHPAALDFDYTESSDPWEKCKWGEAVVPLLTTVMKCGQVGSMEALLALRPRMFGRELLDYCDEPVEYFVGALLELGDLAIASTLRARVDSETLRAHLAGRQVQGKQDDTKNPYEYKRAGEEEELDLWFGLDDEIDISPDVKNDLLVRCRRRVL